MNRTAKWTGLIVFVLFAGAASSGQMMHSRPPQFQGVWNPVVGKGAAYQLTGGSGKNSEIEISIVGKESVDGKDGYWMEMAFSSSEIGGQMLMKHLFVLDGQQTRTAKMIMQMPGHPPMEMPAQMMHRENSAQAADIRTDAQDLGSESLTVPAGTFATEHYRTKDGADMWIAKDVPPWGLVKYQGKDSTMILVRLVSDAKDKIVGTPQPFNPMMMGQHPDHQ